MAKARLLSRNVVLEAATTLTASSEATGYAATNLKNNKRGLPWRSSTGTGDQSIEAAFSSRTIRAVGLLNPVPHTGGDIILDVDTGSGYGGGIGSFDLSAIRTNLSVYYLNATTVIKVKAIFDNVGAVNTFAQLGGLFIVDSNGYYEFPVNVSDKLAYAPMDPSEEAVALGGQKFFNERSPFLALRSRCEWVTAAQKDAILAVRDEVGKRTPVIFAVDPDDLDLTIFGRFGAQAFPAEHGTNDRWHLDTSIEEAL